MKTHVQFLEDLKLLNTIAYMNLEFVEEYAGALTKILIKTKYGLVRTTPNSLLSGKLPTIISAINKHDYFVEEFRINNPTVFKELTIIGEYQTAREGMLFENENGVLLIKPTTLISDIGIIPTIRSAVDRHSYFVKLIKNKHGSKYDGYTYITKYTNARTKITVRDEYGEIETYPQSLMDGVLPTIQTAINKTLYYSNKATKIHDGKYKYDDIKYSGMGNKIKILCKSCNKHFFQNAASHLSGCGCPRCGNSKGEIRISNVLDDFEIEYEEEFTFDDCRNINKLPFDFYIKSHNISIEFDGMQHFLEMGCFSGKSESPTEKLRRTNINDEIRNKYCEDKGIKLIRIPYWEFDKIEEILIKEVINVER